MYIFLCCIVFYVPCISTIYVPIYIIHTTTYIRKALLDIYWHYHIAQLCQFLSSQQTSFLFNSLPCSIMGKIFLILASKSKVQYFLSMFQILVWVMIFLRKKMLILFFIFLAQCINLLGIFLKFLVFLMCLTLNDRKFNNKPNFDILMEKPDSRKPVHEGIKDYKYNLILQTKWYEIAKLTKPNIVQQYYIHCISMYW